MKKKRKNTALGLRGQYFQTGRETEKLLNNYEVCTDQSEGIEMERIHQATRLEILWLECWIRDKKKFPVYIRQHPVHRESR